jgi:hypothetical protein
MKHGAKQARRFLDVIPWQIALQKKQEKGVRSLNAVMDFFAEEAVVELVPPDDLSSGRPSRAGRLQTSSLEEIREVLLWCLRNNLTLEQSRDYRRRQEEYPDRRVVVTCWILATADDFEDPIKGRVEVVVRDGKVERLTFYPLSSKVVRELMANIDKPDRRRDAW